MTTTNKTKMTIDNKQLTNIKQFEDKISENEMARRHFTTMSKEETFETKTEYEMLFCEKCGNEMTNLNGTQCKNCGNWTYSYLMKHLIVIPKQLHDLLITEKDNKLFILESDNKRLNNIIDNKNKEIKELQAEVEKLKSLNFNRICCNCNMNYNYCYCNEIKRG